VLLKNAISNNEEDKRWMSNYSENKNGMLSSNEDNEDTPIDFKNNGLDKIKSAKGIVSINEILQNIYEPYGYIAEHYENDLFIKLQLKEKKTCHQVYIY